MTSKQKPYILVSRESKKEDTAVSVGDVLIGGSVFVVMAGPCAVESKEQVEMVAKAVKGAGAHILRGGAYKPRTSPYSFQGLRKEGLMLLKEAGDKVKLPVISEIVDQNYIPYFLEYDIDVFQVGARNMQNFELLKELGKMQKPILLKRGMSATIEEWLSAAEYILDGGNSNVILCERGIRTFETFTRNTLDISAVPIIKKLSHLPIIIDPSHSSGHAYLIASLSRAAVAVGAHGVIIDVHDKPVEALCDGSQALLPKDFSSLVPELKKLNKIVNNMSL